MPYLVSLQFPKKGLMIRKIFATEKAARSHFDNLAQSYGRSCHGALCVRVTVGEIGPKLELRRNNIMAFINIFHTPN